MRAVVLTSFGAPDKALQLQADHPKPVRKPGEVLIEVHATSVNPGECKVRQGTLPRFMIKMPQILGSDVAGVVLDADASSKFKPGDHVFGCTGQILVDAWGTYAELVSCREERLLHMPQGLSFEQAAALPVVSLTAWRALEPSMPLAGKRVLVHAGAGGIGHMAVQVAKAQGAFVAVTCSGRNTAFCTQELGADLAIDYTQCPSLEEAAGSRSYDLVVDLVGAEPSSWAVLKPGGRMAVVSWDKQLEGLSGNALLFRMTWIILRLQAASALRLCPRYDAVFFQPAPDSGLRQVAELVSAGKVRAHVEQVLPLEAVAEAHTRSETGRVRGKLVIAVKGG